MSKLTVTEEELDHYLWAARLDPKAAAPYGTLRLVAEIKRLNTKIERYVQVFAAKKRDKKALLEALTD